MRFMILVRATRDSEAGVMPSETLFAEMGRFNEELAEAGVLLAGEGLHPSARGARVRFSGANRQTRTGPFPEVDQLVAGYWIWKCDSLDEAIRWVERCPNPMNEDSEIEIRRIYEIEDFADHIPPELREQEERLRERLGGPPVSEAEA